MVDGADSLELAVIENVVREDLTVIEEPRTIASVLDDLDVTTALLATSPWRLAVAAICLPALTTVTAHDSSSFVPGRQYSRGNI